MNDELRVHLLPYCLRRRPDGRWLVTNRNHKPVGYTTTDPVDYESTPCLFTLPDIPSHTLEALSAGPVTDPRRIYLYTEGTTPTLNDADWAAYCRRLRILATLQMAN